MLKLRSLFKEKADESFVLTTGVMLLALAVFLVLFIGGGIMLYFFVEMIAHNIVWIGLAIVMVIAIPILAKAYFTKTTGKMYPEAKKE